VEVYLHSPIHVYGGVLNYAQRRFTFCNELIFVLKSCKYRITLLKIQLVINPAGKKLQAGLLIDLEDRGDMFLRNVG
jgi:sporulation-control protein spo0M